MSPTKKLTLHKYRSVPVFKDKGMKENDKRSVPQRHKEHTAGNASDSTKHGNEMLCISFKILNALPTIASFTLFTYTWHSKVLINCLNFSVLKFVKMNIYISTPLRHAIFLMETFKKAHIFQNKSRKFLLPFSSLQK